MTLELSSQKLELDDEVQLSYFVNHKNRKASRVGHAKLIDISEAGLCMEISPYDSDLFLESQGRLFIMSTQVEMQVFCRSHPINVSMTGVIRWFKQKKEFGDMPDNENIFVGVIFPFASGSQRKTIVDLVGHLKNDVVKCGECGATISADVFICYHCGSRPVRKRSVLKKMILGFLGNSDSP
ncbi:MAG: hypothetical protein C4520_11415 [Candidatus Abyssobacteria bacterium SURF_5]|uniref:PilZ domain-containing protein n=1 Tax=Abyssobacteria bacterium (strain SURF_5) TaxID=2093360 RepID=A0A3A4NHS6_ABYX5|nr:MAG: hypothetical protein C4520_11415 [Candidatus Abyssubacteria bacterium SURF_5]